MVALCGAAYALRLVVLWGIHDFNVRYEAMISDVPGAMPYGHGQAALHAALTLVGTPSDETVIFRAGACLGAPSAVLLVAFGRALGLPAAAATTAGVGLATSGLHARFSPTDAPQILEIALTLLGGWASARVVRQGALNDVVLAGLALGLATTTRPEAVAVPWLVAFAVALSHPPRRWPWRRLLPGVLLVAAHTLPNLVGVALTIPHEGASSVPSSHTDTACGPTDRGTSS